MKLTDDKDPFFLFKLSISEEDFQRYAWINVQTEHCSGMSTRLTFLFCFSLFSLKVQQGLLVDFASFPQKFIDLLDLCCLEQVSENPR